MLSLGELGGGERGSRPRKPLVDVVPVVGLRCDTAVRVFVMGREDIKVDEDLLERSVVRR